MGFRVGVRVGLGISSRRRAAVAARAVPIASIKSGVALETSGRVDADFEFGDVPVPIRGFDSAGAVPTGG